MKAVISKYIFLLQRKGLYLIYSTRTNNFYEISESLFRFISDYDRNKELSEDEAEIVDMLLKKKILVAEGEDDMYYESLKFKHYFRSFSMGNLNVTIAPTVWCNLKCPYCYESSKPKGVMSKEMCDKFIEFLQQAEYSKNLSLTWYGGEPLLGINEIEYLLGRIKKDVKNLRLTEHAIVTNGVLLKGKVIDVFKKHPLTTLQITLDGNRDTHNRIRVKHNGEGTFDEILKNISDFIKEFPSTGISVRVNIDKNNASEFIQVKQMIINMFPEKKNLFVYAGILRGDSSCHDNSFFKSKDTLQFYKSTYDIFPEEEYPQQRGKGCTATCVAGYVIGPRGEIYNCWEDMGKKDKEIGNIADRKLNERELRKYVLHGHAFDDPKCRDCKLLPICDGGCPMKRVENKYHGTDNELCSIYRDNDYAGLEDLLWAYYETRYVKKAEEQ